MSTKKSYLNNRHLKCPALSCFLNTCLHREEVLCVVLLENIQASINDDLPTSVSRNTTSMDLLGFIKGIVELDSLHDELVLHKAKIGILIEESFVGPVFDGDKIDHNLILSTLSASNHIQELA